MIIIGIIGGIVALLILAQLLDVSQVAKEAKASFIVTRDNPIKKKIKTHNPLIGDVILYDFKREQTGEVGNNDGILVNYYVIIKKYFSHSIDENTLEIEYELNKISDADMIELMSATTNILFNTIQFKTSQSNLMTFGKDSPLMKEIKAHVEDLLEDAFNSYVGHIQVIMEQE